MIGATSFEKVGTSLPAGFRDAYCPWIEADPATATRTSVANVTPMFVRICLSMNRVDDAN